jgi:hypothetical protein
VKINFFKWSRRLRELKIKFGKVKWVDYIIINKNFHLQGNFIKKREVYHLFHKSIQEFQKWIDGYDKINEFDVEKYATEWIIGFTILKKVIIVESNEAFKLGHLIVELFWLPEIPWIIRKGFHAWISKILIITCESSKNNFP